MPLDCWDYHAAITATIYNDLHWSRSIVIFWMWGQPGNISESVNHRDPALNCNECRSSSLCRGFSLQRLRPPDYRMTQDCLRVQENDSRLNMTLRCNHEFLHASLLESMDEPLIARGTFWKQDMCHDLEGAWKLTTRDAPTSPFFGIFNQKGGNV